MDERLNDRLWIWIDSLNGWIGVIVNHLSVWIGSGLRIRMKAERKDEEQPVELGDEQLDG